MMSDTNDRAITHRIIITEVYGNWVYYNFTDGNWAFCSTSHFSSSSSTVRVGQEWGLTIAGICRIVDCKLIKDVE